MSSSQSGSRNNSRKVFINVAKVYSGPIKISRLSAIQPITLWSLKQLSISLTCSFSGIFCFVKNACVFDCHSRTTAGDRVPVDNKGAILLPSWLLTEAIPLDRFSLSVMVKVYSEEVE